jgi:hypothetical protein
VHSAAWTHADRIERYTYEAATYELRVEVVEAFGSSVTASVSVLRANRNGEATVRGLSEESAADPLGAVELALRAALAVAVAPNGRFNLVWVATVKHAIQSLACYRLALIAKAVPA